MGKAEPEIEPEPVIPQSTAARPAELEDWLNSRLYHPASRSLALRLKRTWVTPNMVSVCGAMAIIGAAALYSFEQSAVCAAAGLLLHMFWHVLDGADGDLARLTGQSGALGEVVDGLCDYAAHLFMYVLLAWVLADQIGPLGWLVVIAAGVARAVQTTFFETLRRRYLWWTRAVPWLGAGEQEPLPKGWRAFGQVYLSAGALIAGDAGTVETKLNSMAEPDRRKFVSRIERQLLPVLRRSMVLSSNYRTLAIGFSMIAGSPIYFVVFELVALNIVLAVLLIQSRKATSALAA